MTTFRHSIAVRVAIVASLALFIASLGMPALEFAAHEPVRGYEALLWGWWGVLTRDLPWFANPLYFAALLFALTGMKTIAQVCSGLALGFGLLSLRAHQWWFNEGSATPIEKLGWAFYFWMASFLVLFLLLFFSGKPNNSVKDRVDA